MPKQSKHELVAIQNGNLKILIRKGFQVTEHILQEDAQEKD